MKIAIHMLLEPGLIPSITWIAYKIFEILDFYIYKTVKDFELHKKMIGYAIESMDIN